MHHDRQIFNFINMTGTFRAFCMRANNVLYCILLYILFFILRTAYCAFYIVCFYCILGLLLIIYMYICRILLIQLLGCHIEINACLVKLTEQFGFNQYISVERYVHAIGPKSAPVSIQCTAVYFV